MDADRLIRGACFFCQAPAHRYWCEACETDLLAHAGKSRCPVCAAINSNQRICGQCLTGARHFDITRTLFDYSYPLDRFIKSLKYQNRPELMFLLAECFVNHAIDVSSHTLPESLIPVPLHFEKQRQRGFNQAKLFSDFLGKKLGLSITHDAFVRHKATTSQSTLSMLDRTKNVKGAFSQTRQLPFKHVAICDDVVTTGATVNELAKLLRHAGCEEIEVWTLAKTP